MKPEVEALADLHGQLSRKDKELAIATSVAATLYEICSHYQQIHDIEMGDYTGCRCKQCTQFDVVKGWQSRVAN